MPHRFPVQAPRSILRDHGYPLFSGLVNLIPAIHGRKGIQIPPIRGTRAEDGRIRLDQHSYLHIRGLTPEEKTRLEFSWVDLDDVVVAIGKSDEVRYLPSDWLASRLVVLKGAVEHSEYMSVLFEVLQPYQAMQDTPIDVTIGRSGVIGFKDMHFMGHSVQLNRLSDDTSLAIQQNGLGWGTSYGCGVFYRGTLPRNGRHG